MKENNPGNLMIRMNYTSFTSLLLLLIAMSGCLTLRSTDEKLVKVAFAHKITHYTPQVHHYQVQDRDMRYMEIGSDTLPLLVFMHGSPGSLTAFKSYMKDQDLLEKVKIVAVDRPGYGYSGFGKVEKSVEKQAAYIKPILEKYRPLHKKIMLVGSSYGGTVIARLAMDYPHLVDGLMFISSSLAAGAEKIYSISYPTRYPPLRWLLPTIFRVATDEKFAHEKELRKMEPLWKNITIPVSILHGDEDDLVYLENALYANYELKNAPIRLRILPGEGHFLPWTQPKVVKQEMLWFIARVNRYEKTTAGIQRKK